MTGVVDSSANSATVVGDSETGGIVGYNEGRIKLSRNDGKVCPDANENTVNAGGICGNNEGAVVIVQITALSAAKASATISAV